MITADDEDLMTQLFQYRFAEGGLEGHSFGNRFLTALAGITGSMDRALVEAARVLAIQGRVLPSTLQDVTLMAEVRSGDGTGLHRVVGESTPNQRCGCAFAGVRPACKNAETFRSKAVK